MTPQHDMQCGSCGSLFYGVPVSSDSPCVCGGRLDIFWNARPRNARPLGPEETTMVWEHPATGQVVYPGRNDAVMPERYRVAGYRRRELTSLREVDRFSDAHRVVNERAHYDSGSGRGFDDPQ